MKRNGFGEEFGFPEAGVYFRKWVFTKLFLIFHVMKKSFQTRNFAIYGFGSILFVQVSDEFIHCVFGSTVRGIGRKEFILF